MFYPRYRTIPENAPTTGSTYETCTDWLAEQNYYKCRNSIFYKGPLLFSEMSMEHTIWNSCSSITSTKNAIKRKLGELQSQGEPEEWLSQNFKLYNINGLRKSARIANSTLQI